MVNILVPTDFSDLSKVAIDYAIALSNKLNGNVTLLHVVTISQATRASIRFRLEALEDEMMRTAREDMDELVKNVADKVTTGTPLKHEIVFSSTFHAAVKTEAKKLHSGLIVMGTHGATGLKKMMVGSNAMAVIESSEIPVLVVPECASFTGLSSLIYATDMRHINEELDTMLGYLKNLQPTIHIFHKAISEGDVDIAMEKIQTHAATKEYPNFNFKVVAGKSLEEAVESFVEEVGAEVLITFTHTHSVYEKLFGSSLTRNVAFQSKLPLMVFRQNS